MSSEAPWMTVALAALYLTSASSLPTKRKIRLPIGGNKAHARIVYRFLLPPAALGVPPMGACCPGGGGGICDIRCPPRKRGCSGRLWVECRQNARAFLSLPRLERWPRTYSARLRAK